MKKIIVTLMILASAVTSMQAADQPAFEVSTIVGKKLKFIGTDKGLVTEPYKGKIVFVEFWGTWCAPCLMSIPHHQKLQDKYKDQLSIISFETTPDVTKEQLQKYVADPKTHIDMGRIEWYLKHKAKSEAQKRSLDKPIQILKDFKASGHKITYDVVASADGEQFVSYIGQRAGWQGYIPFLMVFDGNGNFVGGVPGMPSEEKLEEIIKNVLSGKK
jgi:thiol-disulfide isomerase/thioredoxin